MAKYGMSMCVLGMAEEFKAEGIAVNALWPKFSVYYILCHFIHLYPIFTQKLTKITR
jgi:NAD(P)-dependent dehydrogenase (short-subunit alcohol dehydrogenase family)